MTLSAGSTPLRPGTPLLCWSMADPLETLYPGVARPMPDRVDYRFVSGRTDVGLSPCREALLAALPSRRVDRPTGEFPHLVVGDDGSDLDFSTFRHRPTLVSRAFRGTLAAAASGVARIRVATCGGLHVWAGARLACAFQPFQRNTPATHEFDLPLAEGETPVTLLLEDLHERDTTCFFSMVWCDGPQATASPGGTGIPAELAEAADLIARLAPDALFHENAPARLVADPPPATPVTCTATVRPFGRGGLSHDPDAALRRRLRLAPDTPAARLFSPAELPAGCLSVTLTAEVGSARVSRSLGTTNLPPGTPLAGDLAARKARAARIIAEHRGFEPSVALLLALRGQAPDHVANVLDVALKTIEERHDCSDFTILPLLRLWRDAKDGLPHGLRDRLRRAFLGYRYWLDEPGDDVMWFWSENHVLCFHVAQLVAGGLFADEIFTNSGKTGAQHRAQAHARLLRWFDAIDADGLCEWNSAAYYPIDLLGLLTLHDMAPDLRPRAAALIDRIFIMTGLHSTGGVPAGSQGRCYEKELLAGPATELGATAAIAFGGTFRPGHDRAAALFCLSDYAPPAVAGQVARPNGRDWLEARYTQGFGHAGKLTLWKSAEAQLSTVSELAAGTMGHQAQVLDVQLAAHPLARLWVNHPGETKPWGDRRPSLLAGSHVLPQVAQYGPTGLMIFDLDRPWTQHRFSQLFAVRHAFDGADDIADDIAAGWRLFRSGNGRAAVWCSAELHDTDGLYRGALFRAHAPRCGWVVALPLPTEPPQAFAARLAASPPTFDAGRLRLRATGHDGAPLTLDFTGGLRLHDRPLPFGPLSTRPHVGWNGAPLAPLPL